MSESRVCSVKALHQVVLEPYPVPMPVSARDVAAALRERHPGLGIKKVHKLLYYAQGHHLATFGQPLFKDTISAWDMGPVVGTLWYEERSGETAPPISLDEAQLNTIGYVLSRYGALSGQDLENLTHSETPWQRANDQRRPGQSARIELEWIAEFFLEAAGADEGEAVLDSSEVTAWLQDADRRLADPLQEDDLDKLREMLTAS